MVFQNTVFCIECFVLAPLFVLAYPSSPFGYMQSSRNTHHWIHSDIAMAEPVFELEDDDNTDDDKAHDDDEVAVAMGPG